MVFLICTNRGDLMISLKEWAGLLKKARIHEEMRQRTDATIRAAGSLLSAGEREAVAPVIKRIIHAGAPLYKISAKTARGLKLLAASHNEIIIETACPVCSHLYSVKVRSWKTRGRDCIAPCPECSAFQLIDLDALRKERSATY
jgi:hypothetical protein